MRYRLSFAVIAAMMLTSCSQATVSVEELVRQAVVTAKPRLPMQEGDDLTLTDVTGDGRVLTMHFDTTADGSVSTSQAALSAQFREQICGEANFREIIDAGGVVRFSIRRPRTGEALPPFGIASCS